MKEPIQQPQTEPAPASTPEVSGQVRPPAGGAVVVAAGILMSRVLGLLRERVIAGYFGLGPHADVLRVAFRAPNVIQNLLGEGTLSAAFIPIYSRMVEEGRREEAGRFAG
ncbi:MAG TPA: lipid II flippase MurJ, partial [Thermoanaerobaculia bacterium]|nr:lipid II flippase MurJ [Thermoanaerobaculia bacterium]